MMWVFGVDGVNVVVLWLLDSAAEGQTMPGWAPEFGILLGVSGALILLGLIAGAVYRSLRDRRRPTPGNLLETDPWLAEDTTQTRPMRKPSPAALRGGVYHGAAVEDPDETQTFNTSATAVIARVRPARYKGGRRG